MSSSANGDHSVRLISRFGGMREQPILIGPVIPAGLMKYTDFSRRRTSVMLTLQSHFDIARQFCVVYLTLLCHDCPSPDTGGERNGRSSVAVGSCPLLSERRLQKSVHWNGTARYLAQSNGQTQGSLAAAGEDVAQVRRGTFGGIGELLDRHSGIGGPAKHGVWF